MKNNIMILIINIYVNKVEMNENNYIMNIRDKIKRQKKYSKKRKIKKNSS
jgi:hypothetical protein